MLQEQSFTGMDNFPDSTHTEHHVPLSSNAVTLLESTRPHESPLPYNKCSQIQLKPYGDGTYHNGESPGPTEASGSNKQQYDDT